VKKASEDKPKPAKQVRIGEIMIGNPEPDQKPPARNVVFKVKSLKKMQNNLSVFSL